VPEDVTRSAKQKVLVPPVLYHFICERRLKIFSGIGVAAVPSKYSMCFFKWFSHVLAILVRSFQLCLVWRCSLFLVTAIVSGIIEH